MGKLLALLEEALTSSTLRAEKKFISIHFTGKIYSSTTVSLRLHCLESFMITVNARLKNQAKRPLGISR